MPIELTTALRAVINSFGPAATERIINTEISNAESRALVLSKADLKKPETILTTPGRRIELDQKIIRELQTLRRRGESPEAFAKRMKSELHLSGDEAQSVEKISRDLDLLSKPRKEVSPAQRAAWDRARARTEETKAAADRMKAVKKTLEKEFVLVWRLSSACNHCRFCPMIADTEEELWGRFVDGPPAHIGCCCFLEPQLRSQLKPKAVSVTLVITAAKESGIAGFKK